jgi:hypothetical protein
LENSLFFCIFKCIENAFNAKKITMNDEKLIPLTPEELEERMKKREARAKAIAEAMVKNLQEVTIKEAAAEAK